MAVKSVKRLPKHGKGALATALAVGLLCVSFALPASATGSWTPPVDLSAIGQHANGPQITVDSNGTLTAIWYSTDGSNYIVQTATSSDHGQTWSAPTNLSTTGGSADAPQITVDSNGTLTAIWTRNNGSNYIVQTATSSNHGQTWTTPTNLSTPGGDAGDPQITVDSNDTLTAIWRRYNGSNYIIQASSLLAPPTPDSDDTLADTGANTGAATSATLAAFGALLLLAAGGTTITVSTMHRRNR